MGGAPHRTAAVRRATPRNLGAQSTMQDMLDIVQWVAMVVTIAAAYLVASQNDRRRHVGFWTFIASNVLWIAWGLHAAAYALVVLQLFLGVTNVRGVWKTRRGASRRGAAPRGASPHDEATRRAAL